MQMQKKIKMKSNKIIAYLILCKNNEISIK